MHTDDFQHIVAEFKARADKMVWCCMATVGPNRRPRTRVVHQLWEDSVGWITTDRNSFKGRHLRSNPYVSLGYVSDVAKPMYVDCLASWADGPDEKQHVWDLCLRHPEPVGFDPAPIYGAVDAPGATGISFGVLRPTPYRVVLTQFPEPTVIWAQALPNSNGD